MEPLISFHDVTLGYGRRVVLRNLDFQIRRGDYFGLVGPNGAGKTTILRAILGTLRPLAGEVRTHAPAGTTMGFGYVPQRDTVENVLPYTVDEIVMMGRYRSIGTVRHPGARDREIVGRCLAAAGIRHLGGKVFRDLSGGQKQRTLIARALAVEPDVLILDEPTNGMDLPSRTSILHLIDSLHADRRLTIIMVSHLLDDVANHAERLAIVEREQFQVGATDDLLTAGNLSSLYGVPVRVERCGDRVIILPGGTHER